MRIPLVLHAHPQKRTVPETDVEGALCALLVPATEAAPGARAAATAAVNELCAARRRWLALFHKHTDDEDEDESECDAALEDHAAAHIIATQMYVAHLRALTAAPHLRAATAFAWTAAYGPAAPVAANDTAYESGAVLVAAALGLLRLAAHAATHHIAPTTVFYEAPFLAASAPSTEPHEQQQEQERKQQQQQHLKVDATVVVEEVLQCALSLLNAYTACVRRKLCPAGDAAHAAALPGDLGALVPVLHAQAAAQLREVAVLRACASPAQARPRRLAARCARLAARYDAGVAQALAAATEAGACEAARVAPFAAYARTKGLVYRALAEHFRALAALEAFRPRDATRRAAVAAALLRDAVAAAGPAGEGALGLANTVHDEVLGFRDALLASFPEGDGEDEEDEEDGEDGENQDDGEGEDDEGEEELVRAVGMPEAMDCVWTPEVVNAFRMEPVPPLLAPWRDVPPDMSDADVRRVLTVRTVCEDTPDSAAAAAAAQPKQSDTPASSGTCTIC